MAYNILYNHASTEERALEFLQRNLLLRMTPPDCPEPLCFRTMTLVKTGRGEERCFRCPSHKGQKVFLTKDTYFENSKLSCKNIVELIFSWSLKLPVCDTVRMTGLGEKSIIQWFAYFRDVCSWWLIQNPYKIGGPGMEVEIDESVVARRKYHRGRLISERWVFGGVDRNTNKSFLELIPDKSAATLLGIIEEKIEPGSIIHTDGHAAYNGIPNIPVQPPYQHLVVIHRTNFVDPVTAACTNTVEGHWSKCKKRLKHMNGVQDTMLPSHLDEFMWRELFGREPIAAFNNFIDHLSQWYPAP